MTEYARLVVAVDSTQAAKARVELEKLPASARKASAGADAMSSSFRRLGGVLATYFSVREVVKAAEAYTTINNRLRLVTSSSEELSKAQRDLFQIAQNSRQPLTETAELYQRIATNQKQLGLTGEGVARITEVINKSLAVSGTSAASAAGALTQLGQAFASGQLRGEELNSVLENAPALAQALARGMGVTVGELRALGAEGKISAQEVVDALLSQGDALDQQFATLAPTVSGAMTTVGNAFIQLVGQMDETSGASAGAAAEIMKLAGILSDPNTVQAAQELAGGIATALGWVVEAASSTVSTVKWMAEELAALFGGIGLHDIDRLEAEASRLQELLNTMEQRGETGYAIYGSTQESFNKVKAQLDQAYELADLASNLQRGSGAPAPVSAPQRPALRLASGGAGVIEKEVSNSKALQAQLKAELAAKRELTAQEQIRIDILRESGQLRAANDAQFELEYAEKIAEYERQGNVEALQRLETLRRIRDVQLNADQAPGTVEGVSAAPRASGLNAVVGGAGSELIRLQQEAVALEEWRTMELEKQRAFLETKAINEQQHADRVANIHLQSAEAVANIQGAQTLAVMSLAQGLTNDMMSLMQQAGQENTALYKAMFVAQKAIAIGQAIISTELAAVSAMAPPPFGLGPVAGLPYSQVIRALGYASVGIIGAQTVMGLSGMAHDGIDSIPKEGTWLLDRGERVVDRRTNADLKNFLSSDDRSSATPNVQIINNGDPVSAKAEMDGETMKIILDRVQSDFIGSLQGDGKYSQAIGQKFGLKGVGR